MKDIYSSLIDIAGAESVKCNEPLSKHITFRVGGNADYYVSVNSEKKAVSLIRLLSIEKIPFFIIGNGSNLLVSDDGFRGVVIEIGKDMSCISISGDTIIAEAGALMVKIANEAYRESLTGLEFSSGIPGTIGGGTCMNAGAYGGELKDVITSVRLYDIESGEIIEKSGSEMEFGYRHSIIKNHPYVVLSVTLKLSKGNQDEIKTKMDELKAQRTEKQPLEYPSAGSTFKRPEGYFAGKLIQDAGLKGYTVGGAQVSEKHSGFVINKGNATAKDIYLLINDVKTKVLEDFGVELTPEVIMLGDFR